MHNQKGDVLAEVKFCPTQCGGRQGPTPTDELHCILSIDSLNFDVRIYFGAHGPVSPGEKILAPIRFLHINAAMPHLAVGRTFTLRERTTIADGVITKILF